MNQETLQDRISRGLGVAARQIGASTDAYRPAGAVNPLARANRYLRLSAAFSTTGGTFNQASTYGNSLWYGVFDAAYTRPGDYLVQHAGIWFIAAQQPLLPVLCVRTDRTVSFSRPSGPAQIGANSYGGVALSTARPILENWPASVLGTSGAKPNASLPADSTAATWTVMLPQLTEIILRPTDIMTDDLGRSGIVSTAELTALGWRLVVRQSST